MINKLKQLYNNSEELQDVTGKEEEEAAIGHSGFSFFVGKHLLSPRRKPSSSDYALFIRYFVRLLIF